MALYNRQTIHWKLQINDSVGYFRNPFFEYKVDPVFKVISITDDNCYMDIEVIKSSFLVQGTVYRNQPTWGFKRVKLASLANDLTYDWTGC
ncbi:hypothetical protein N9948_02105 [bacterium]|nr:hypothetical protein [bacterium]